jgi:hypothetical protein
MRKIIDGKRFDTDRAVAIGAASHGYHGDHDHWEATLYRTPRSGRYFIAGSGGPASRFSQSAGQNTWVGGEDLIPMTTEEARRWAESYLDADAVEQFFDVEEA